MKRAVSALLSAALMLSVLTGCGKSGSVSKKNIPAEETAESKKIALSDSGITVDGAAISDDETAAVYAAQDIVYYEEGQGVAYGAGTDADAHSQEEADAHTVVHITQPGTYTLSGTLSAGQIAVDLGDGAEEDPEAVVTIVLDGVDITCTVASAIIFYRVYECGSADMETATQTVDTSAAGANVVIADGTENRVTGSHVAKIYKPESVTLNADGTAVEEAKKLHKYDGALYSKMSMNVSGGEAGTGTLEIVADNEGLDSELHLTINSGNIHILAGNDGINTNEDGVSVTTINGGTLRIEVTGETGEGDGIDSNGWLVINGGIVIASGNMYDAVDGGDQTYAVFQFAQKQSGGQTYTLKNAAGETILEMTPENAFQYLVVSAPGLAEGEYTLWCGDTQLGGSTGSVGGPSGGMGRPDGQPPEGAPGQKPEGADDGQQPPEPPADGQRPEGGPNGAMDGGNSADAAERSDTFTLQSGANQFTNVGALT